MSENENNNQVTADILMFIGKLILTVGAPLVWSRLQKMGDEIISADRIGEADIDKKPETFFPCLGK